LGVINDDDMRALNYQVDIEHLAPYIVAKEYLKSHHFIP
jgi:glycine betaine/choline ABC-type transport system substrate-binding protein